MSKNFDSDAGKLIKIVDDGPILINENGSFPKQLIIIKDGKKQREYQLKKTKSGKYLLN